MRAAVYGRRAGTALLLVGLVALAALGPVGVVGGMVPTADASGCPYSVALGTSSNTFGDSLGLGWTDPTMLVFITPKWEPNAVYDNHPVGVWYDGSEWAAFNEDGATMPAGASLNVLVTWAGDFPPLADAFVQTATGGNISGDATILNDPLANNNPSAIILVTPNWNPGGTGGGVYNNHPIGVYYTGSRWAIFNQDGAWMTADEAFNVLVLPGATGDANTGASVQTATASTISGNVTLISPAPAASTILLVTPNWNPPGHAGLYFNHNLGVSLYWLGWGLRPAIFTQDGAAMPVGASFNILAHPLCP